MITVSITQLVSAIEEADVYKMPDMSGGAEYIYDNIYMSLLRGEDVKLSQINWDSFELEDVDTMRDLHSDVLEANESKADSLASTLQGISPVTVTAAAFV